MKKINVSAVNVLWKCQDIDVDNFPNVICQCILSTRQCYQTMDLSFKYGASSRKQVTKFLTISLRIRYDRSVGPVLLNFLQDRRARPLACRYCWDGCV